jgi:hypothetical protein
MCSDPCQMPAMPVGEAAVAGVVAAGAGFCAAGAAFWADIALPSNAMKNMMTPAASQDKTLALKRMMHSVPYKFITGARSPPLHWQLRRAPAASLSILRRIHPLNRYTFPLLPWFQ